MIYLDHNATSPLLPEVREAMEPWLGVPANPSSAHRLGQRAAVAVEEAREQVAALLGRPAAGIVFTSGATEANHMALRGLPSGRVALSGIEHPSVRGALAHRRDLVQELLPVGASGVIQLDGLGPVDALVVMAANHETGVIQDLEAARASAPSAHLHVDATQAAGRIPLRLEVADTVVISSHKLGGPGGMGCLSLPDGEIYPPLLGGGTQERGRRAGTVPTAAVVGFGAACRLARATLEARRARWQRQSDRLREGLLGLGARLVGDRERLLPNTTCVVFPGIAGETLVQALDLAGICASSGAACASGSTEPSPVLTAMGDPEPAGGLRLSLGPRSEDTDVDALLAVLPAILEGLRLAAELDHSVSS